MGSSSGGGKKKYINFRSRQRANMSFFIVVMFFAIFGIIVFTEIFFIDERDRASGVLVRHGPLTYQQKPPHEKTDYNDGFQIFFIDERDRASGVLVRHGPLTYQQKPPHEKTDYDDGFQNEDYISIRVGAAMMNDETLGALLLAGKSPLALQYAAAAAVPQSSKLLTESWLPPYPENFTLSEGNGWQNVNGTRYKFFVFSAYYDKRRNQRIIRIIGATKTRGAERVWCRLWYKIPEGNSTMNMSKTIPAKIKVIRENWNLRYSACFIMCPLRNNLTVPLAVSIVAKLTDSPSNILVIGNNHNETKPPDQPQFGVCVKPLHFEYNKELEILEFLELNRLMGVSHFTFYNHTIGKQVSCILRDYAERGLVTLLPWKLQMVSQKEIRTEGLFAALNDCLYRSMYKYSHVLLIDLDEYIIPKYNHTLPQLIDYISHRLNTRSTGSFSFQNAFFYLQWPDDDDVYDFTDPISSSLVTLKKTRRRSKLHPHKQRSKYVCRPELVVEAGNHFVWEFIPGHGTLNVPADASILHHYRICEFGGDDCIKTSSTVDKTAYRYKDTLSQAVRSQYDRLRSKCDLSDLKAPPTRVFDKIMNMLKSGGQRR